MFGKSKEHLDSVDESYLQHLFFTLKYGGACFVAGFMVIVHGFIPSLFETSASRTIKKLAGATDKDCREVEL